jgi:hypothetical protein
VPWNTNREPTSLTRESVIGLRTALKELAVNRSWARFAIVEHAGVLVRLVGKPTRKVHEQESTAANAAAIRSNNAQREARSDCRIDRISTIAEHPRTHA